MTLGIALRYVLEALRRKPQHKMFRFGRFALDQFRSRLTEWPQYCQHMEQISHLAELYPELAAIRAAASGKGAPGDSGADAAAAEDGPGGSSAATVEESAPAAAAEESIVPAAPTSSGQSIKEFLLSTAPLESATSPPSEPLARASQATQFIINQLTAMNVSDKVVKMRELLQVEHPRRALAQGRTPEADDPARVSIDWFAQYLVVKRVASQANFHDVYLSFIEQLETKENELSKAVLRCTLKICRQLLSSDTIRVEEQERRLLKTLGGWLGLVTLARNKPVLHRDLDLKELLYVAYERGSLVAVMPFVAKVMDGAQKSKIFAPPNPWTMALMNALGEMYAISDFIYRYILCESC